MICARFMLISLGFISCSKITRLVGCITSEFVGFPRFILILLTNPPDLSTFIYCSRICDLIEDCSYALSACHLRYGSPYIQETLAAKTLLLMKAVTMKN